MVEPRSLLAAEVPGSGLLGRARRGDLVVQEGQKVAEKSLLDLIVEVAG